MPVTQIDYEDKLHTIKVKLYPEFLPGLKGRYIARTINEGVLKIEDVCDQMKIRGGHKGDYNTLVHNVRDYFLESAYHLANGWAVDTGYYTIYPVINGLFRSATEPYDAGKHRIDFRFRIGVEMRRLIDNISVVVAGAYDGGAYIREFTDTETGTVNGRFTPGNMFSISGMKIKVSGTDPACGVFFVPVDNPAQAVRVERIAENTRKKITGIAPDTGHRRSRIEIRTQYTGSSKQLKEPRIITSSFEVTAL